MLKRLPEHNLADPIDHFGGNCQCTGSNKGTQPAFLTNELQAGNSIEVGMALYYQQQYNEAIEILNQIDRNDTRKPLVDYFVGASYICLDDGARAARYWQQEAMAWRAFKGIYRCRLAGEELRAATLYDLALTIEPNLAQVGYLLPDTALAYYLAAASVSRERDLPDMELIWLQIGLAKFPDEQLANYRLGEFYERSGNLTLAQRYYQQALSYSAQDDTSIYPHYIRASFLLEDWSNGAMIAKELLIKLQPDHEHQGRVVMALINQHLNPDLCQQMQGLINDVEQLAVGDIVDQVVDVRNRCANFE